jgi:transposase
MVRKHGSRFRDKKNAIISLYRKPPDDGPVVCFDEIGPLQTIPRGGRSWGRIPVKRSDRYSRKHGALQFFAAFCPMTGKAVGQGTPSKNSENCRDFLSRIIFKTWRRGRIHLILDNLSAHKAAPVSKWACEHPDRIEFHWLPTNSSWLNLIESYFATLERTALQNTDYKTPIEIENALQKGIAYLNENPRPYVWKKL